MAGIEQIVVHSKSYLVRWIQVPERHSISWSVEPHKKSINFGIFKHPGTKALPTPLLPTHETVDGSHSLPPTPGLDGAPQSSKRPRSGSAGKSEESAAVAKLRSIGLKEVAWTGRCEADRVSMGRYDVPDGEGGMYALVFDNTFSKQTGKTIHFVLITHPTSAPPKSGHQLHYSNVVAAGSGTTLGKSYSPSLGAVSDSKESLPAPTPLSPGQSDDGRPISKSGNGMEARGMEGATFYTGTLNKKRRKKGQGYAKRFFSLDFTSSTLSYYRDGHSSALRGAVPLSLAAVGVNEKTREFSIDSGAEVWHLKALNRKDFDGWRSALEKAATVVVGGGTTDVAQEPPSATSTVRPSAFDPVADHEWLRVEGLVSKVSGTRDAVRALAKDTDPKYLLTANGMGLGVTSSANSSSAPSPTAGDMPGSYFPDGAEQLVEKRPFWKRKSSAGASPSPGKRSVSAQLAIPSPTPPLPNSLHVAKRSGSASISAQIAEDMHERCMALLRDLDSVVADFAALIAESKARRRVPMPTSRSRISLESADNQEFFDAEDGEGAPAQLLNLRDSHDEDERDHGSDADSDASSIIELAKVESPILNTTPKTAHEDAFAQLPKTLPPLPHSPVKRRTNIQPPKQAPPSIISFLRKNAGKDLSTVSMPVTANEPLSLLQRLAESLEYSRLLDHAAAPSTSAAERLAYVSAFAVSYFANNRVKERAMRKPFNPMLGETFELVREDLGFRFVAEKVSHHPVRMACQAESLNNGGWCLSQAPQPEQKFWGKSMELNTEGRVRVALLGPNEHYSWNQATCFLRNVIAGEKYVEPVQTMTVTCDTNGMRAVATFKAGGMFSGRSEEVNVALYGSLKGDVPLPLGLTGKWTESLRRTDNGAEVWTVGSLVPDAAKGYGFTEFAATLNQVTEMEQGRLPPTDSRLRPDQLALESGQVDEAEALKARLEERQRARRKVRESHGQTWQPQFFEKLTAPDSEGDGSDTEDVWILKRGHGYWERRERKDWTGIEEVFEI